MTRRGGGGGGGEEREVGKRTIAQKSTSLFASALQGGQWLCMSVSVSVRVCVCMNDHYFFRFSIFPASV